MTWKSFQLQFQVDDRWITTRIASEQSQPKWVFKSISNTRPQNMESHITCVWMIYIQNDFSKMSLNTLLERCKFALSAFEWLIFRASFWMSPQMAYLNRKHCQRHNGPEGWVHLIKVSSWGQHKFKHKSWSNSSS